MRRSGRNKRKPQGSASSLQGSKKKSKPTVSSKSAATKTAIAAAVSGTVAPLSERTKADVLKSVAAAQKEAKAATARALTEEANRTKCFQKEASVMTDHAPTTNLSTTHAAPTVRAAAQPVGDGDYVRVSPDRSVGHNCPGGYGWVMNVTGEGAALTANVSWSAFAGGSKDVPLKRLVVILPFAASPVRACRLKAALEAVAAKAAAAIARPLLSDKPIQEALLSAKLRGLRKGWRRREICGKKATGKRLSYEQKLLAGADCRELWAFLDGYKTGGGRAAARLTLSNERTKKGRIVLVEREGPWEGTLPLSKQFLFWSWGIGRGPLDVYAKARQAL